MVFMMIRQDDGPLERPPKMLEVELENNSKISKGPSRKTGIVTAKRKFNLLFSR
jgi:hypothetical protein